VLHKLAHKSSCYRSPLATRPSHCPRQQFCHRKHTGLDGATLSISNRRIGSGAVHHGLHRCTEKGWTLRTCHGAESVALRALPSGPLLRQTGKTAHIEQQESGIPQCRAFCGDGKLPSSQRTKRRTCCKSASPRGFCCGILDASPSSICLAGSWFAAAREAAAGAEPMAGESSRGVICSGAAARPREGVPVATERCLFQRTVGVVAPCSVRAACPTMALYDMYKMGGVLDAR